METCTYLIAQKTQQVAAHQEQWGWCWGWWRGKVRATTLPVDTQNSFRPDCRDVGTGAADGGIGACRCFCGLSLAARPEVGILSLWLILTVSAGHHSTSLCAAVDCLCCKASMHTALAGKYGRYSYLTRLRMGMGPVSRTDTVAAAVRNRQGNTV